MKNASKIINMLTSMGIESTDQINGKMFAQRTIMGSMIPSMDKISAELERIDEQIRHTQHFLEISSEYERYKNMGNF